MKRLPFVCLLLGACGQGTAVSPSADASVTAADARPRGSPDAPLVSPADARPPGSPDATPADARPPGSPDATPVSPADARPPGSPDATPADARPPGLPDAARTPVPDAATAAADADTSCTPISGVIYVAPTGDDSTGNGSPGCPYATIQKTIGKIYLASAATTVILASGTAAAPYVYGDGCTAGAGKCDSGELQIVDGARYGFTLRGASSDPRATRLVDLPFYISSFGSVFEDLTLVITKVATTTSTGRAPGGSAVTFNSAAPSTMSNVVIEGVPLSPSSDSTGPALIVDTRYGLTLGPGVTITGGDYAVDVGQGASATITSSTAQPTFFHETQFACVMVAYTGTFGTQPTATLGATSGQLHLQDCGAAGVLVSTAAAGTPVAISDTLIDATSASASGNGIQIQAVGAATVGAGVTVTGLAGDGLLCDPGGSTSPSVTIGGGASFLANAGDGVHLGPACTATMDTGQVIFNTTAAKNGLVGLCDSSSTALSVGMGTFGCGLGATASCEAAGGSVEPIGVADCTKTGDYNSGASLTVLAPTCCGK